MPAAENIYAVILAGGSGTRFWPQSRQNTPKQLCKINSDTKTMLELTLERLDGYIPLNRQLIVTGEHLLESTQEVLGDQCPKLLAEPEAKNTANALAMAAFEIQSLHKGSEPAIMISLHADALIENTAALLQTLDKAVSVAQQGYLTLIGVPPKYPETGYGYLEKAGALAEGPGFEVASFKEKPDQAQAKIFVQDPNLYWNTGIFVWQTSQLLAELEQHCPQVHAGLAKPFVAQSVSSYTELSSQQLVAIYQALPNLAIDPAVIEKSSNIAMVEASFDWQDIGSWDALEQVLPTDVQGNVLRGEGIVALDCSRTTVATDGPIVACLGLEDMVVVVSNGCVLVCPKSRAQDVKQVVTELKSRGQESFT